MDDRLERDLSREGLVLTGGTRRTFAYLIDEVLISMIVLIAFWNDFSQQEDIRIVIETVNSFFWAVVGMKVMYQTLFVYLYGASLGKILTKCMVVSYDDFSRPTLQSALIRAVVRIVSEMVFYLGFIWAFMNPARQTWHDKMAKTLVIDAY